MLPESLRHTDGVIAVNRNSNRGTHHAEQIKIHDFFVGQIFYVRMRSSVSDVVGNAVEKIVVLRKCAKIDVKIGDTALSYDRTFRTRG